LESGNRKELNYASKGFLFEDFGENFFWNRERKKNNEFGISKKIIKKIFE